MNEAAVSKKHQNKASVAAVSPNLRPQTHNEFRFIFCFMQQQTHQLKMKEKRWLFLYLISLSLP